MMTSLNGDIFRVTGSFWGESTGDRWIPLTKVSDVEFPLICTRTTAEQTIKTPVIWNAIVLIMTSL